MLGSLLLALALFASPLLADSTGEWRSYGATAASTKYAPFDQIDATNFAQLEIAWTWASADQPILDAHPEIWTMVFEGTPLQVGDRLYVSTSLNLVVALDATNGKTIWDLRPRHLEIGYASQRRPSPPGRLLLGGRRRPSHPLWHRRRLSHRPQRGYRPTPPELWRRWSRRFDQGPAPANRTRTLRGHLTAGHLRRHRHRRRGGPRRLCRWSSARRDHAPRRCARLRRAHRCPKVGL